MLYFLQHRTIFGLKEVSGHLLWRMALLSGILLVLLACQPQEVRETTASQPDSVVHSVVASDSVSCHDVPKRFATPPTTQAVRGNPGKGTTEGMVWIEGGTFMMGADNQQARPDELPKHAVRVGGFWMDQTEVTNAQFAAFVQATGYQTTAERKPDWQEIKKQLPPGTPRPPDSVLVASSLVFTAPARPVSLHDYSQWWRWQPGADWRHPEGPQSSIQGKENHPVVHISWDDAVAYCQWAGKRLPTEAEWEWAARGGLENNIYPWGNQAIEQGEPRANTWQGRFPDQNTTRDGYFTTAPVKAFPPNGYGLYDMAGNVWEWCQDYYRPDYYQTLHQQGESKNPKGPAASYDPEEPTVPKRVQRGGSFLCHDSYCASYRTAARMKASPDTGLSHSGFRCVKDQ